MRKEEILVKDKAVFVSAQEFTGLKEDILAAMDEYAKQESIDFGKFISANGWQQYDEPDRWIFPSNNKDVITTEQLYERYAKRT